jgi:uncharacterized membrane protein YidH (DUF202 family)
LQTQAGQEPPQWIRDLTQSHIVEAVPKFSKFIHGTASMFPSRINLLPFWMPQMDTDIRKPITHRFGIERPANTASYTTSESFGDDSEDEDDEDDEGHHDDEDKDDDEEDDNLRKRPDQAREAIDQNERESQGADSTARANGNALDIEERIAAGASLEEDYPIYDSEEDDEQDALEEAKHSGQHLKYALLITKKHAHLASDKILDLFHHIPTTAPMPQSSGIGGVNPMGGKVQATRFKAPKGKRIHVPVRVEPKVYFAAERTFLSWMEFSIILGSIAATLLNFGDNVSLISAWGFTIVACLALLYSVGIYYLRVQMIRTRRATVSRYYDKWGPTGLCVGLLAATLVNFVLKVREDGWFEKTKV